MVRQCNPGVYSVDMGQAKSSGERQDENIYSFVSPMSQAVSYRLFPALHYVWLLKIDRSGWNPHRSSLLHIIICDSIWIVLMYYQSYTCI